MQEDDLIRLRHMLDAAREATAFAKGRSRSDLDNDRMLLLSLTKDIEIIGEAASKLSQETHDTNSSIPWASIIAMRNRLIHAYFDIDPDRVWDTVKDDLPPLVAELEKIIASEEQE
ncbi:MAG TPA: HepT-like ribonuclease domain-containing protein [Anaerolineales bacterium]|nr:HepT-like ribonuclease domain-containing protein [Anaerolineales bacterium]HLB46914.1 HepT-like ribonuclease domain-containing protein [Anaerolineales bacterium]